MKFEGSVRVGKHCNTVEELPSESFDFEFILTDLSDLDAIWQA